MTDFPPFPPQARRGWVRGRSKKAISARRGNTAPTRPVPGAPFWASWRGQTISRMWV